MSMLKLSYGKIRTTSLFVLLLILSGFTKTGLTAQEPAKRDAIYAVTKINDFTITGKGDNENWEKAAWLPLIQRGPSEDMNICTQVKILYSKTGVYCLFYCQDNQLTATMNADFMDLWKEDVVEIFLWPDENYPVYFEYEMSPLNYELAILVSNIDGDIVRWQPFHYECDRKTSHATHITKDEKQPDSLVKSWTAECFIPFKLLKPLNNVPPKSGDYWRANFYRVDYDAGVISNWLWQLTEKNFHDIKSFGYILFQ